LVHRAGASALALGVALSMAACGDGGGATASLVVVDTLPNGAVRTISSAPTEAGQWRLTLLHTVQPAEGDSGELQQPQDLALTADGTLLVSESGDAHVKVFDATGRYRRRIGRNGEGPGEFRVAFLAARGDTVLVQDPQVARASTFRISDGAFLGSRPTTCCYWQSLGTDGAGRAILPANHSPDDSATRSATAWVRIGFGGTGADTVFVWQGRRRSSEEYWEIGDGKTLQMRMPVPYAPREVETTDARGGWVTAWTGEYLLRATSTGDDTIALFGRPFTPPPVSAREKSRLVELRVADMSDDGRVPDAMLRAGMAADKIPDRRPAFESLVSDAAGRTWVPRLLDDSASVVEFDLFGADRRWLDVVRLPKSAWAEGAFAPTAWGEDRVAVAVEDADGRPAVRVYGIERVKSAKE
jgi:hypothetical protein